VALASLPVLCLPANKNDSNHKGLDSTPRVKSIYPSYMSCHNDRARTLSMGESTSPRCGAMPPPLHHYPLRNELDKGGLKVEPTWERKLTQNKRLTCYFRRSIDGRVRDRVSTQDEGSSQYLLWNRPMFPRKGGTIDMVSLSNLVGLRSETWLS
jgi:hypothetical protein